MRNLSLRSLSGLLCQRCFSFIYLQPKEKDHVSGFLKAGPENAPEKQLTAKATRKSVSSAGGWRSLTVTDLGDGAGLQNISACPGHSFWCFARGKIRPILLGLCEDTHFCVSMPSVWQLWQETYCLHCAEESTMKRDISFSDKQSSSSSLPVTGSSSVHWVFLSPWGSKHT